MVVADNSRSLQITNGDGGTSRGAQMRESLADKSSWLTQLAQDFDVRRYLFDTQARSVKTFMELTHDGTASAIHASLATPPDWFQGIRATKAAKSGTSVDGLHAARWRLVASSREDHLPEKVRSRRDELERELVNLRQLKEKLSANEYLQQLEPLSIELAKLYEAAKRD